MEIIIIFIFRITNVSPFILISMISWILFEETTNRKHFRLNSFDVIQNILRTMRNERNCIWSELCSEMTFGNRCNKWAKHGKSVNILKYASSFIIIIQLNFTCINPFLAISKGPLLVWWWWRLYFSRIMKFICRCEQN